MNKKEEIKKIILEFEEGKVTLESTLLSISNISGKNIEAYELKNYWRSENLDSFVEHLTAMPIENWKDIDDQKAISLIQEILDNITEDPILLSNSEALEKRYSKPSGTISDYIFQDDISDANEILVLLKKEDTILL